MSAKTRASSVQQGYQQQADATLSQANPVSTTLYTVLDTTKNVRIIGIEADITWATTQPTPLEVVVTIDGVVLTAALVNPVSGTLYQWMIQTHAAEPQLVAANTSNKSFELEGRSVKVEARITWATTQPTPLVCRVKYAKIP